jgi:exodeoxyribonuclease VII large subunit
MTPSIDPPEFSDPFGFGAEAFLEDRSKRTIYSVSELTKRIKSLLEANFPFVWICGEISNFRMPGSGHYYFTLKDEHAQIAAVMFRGQNRQMKFVPEDGMSIIGLGRISVYEPRGSYQIILEYIEPAGIGALQLAFEQLKKRLADEGYFEQRHKKPIPFLPAKISVVTSPSGAVVHDIITILSRRFPNLHIEVVPVKVQGAGAEDDIADALKLLNDRADADVIILARGGGSLEDLQAFNSESVAMAIFSSRIPVISGVGHETDVTIADFIADLRAPTPSAAAELVVPEKNELLRRCRELEQSLRSRMSGRLENLKRSLDEMRRRLVEPRRKIQEYWLRLDDLSGRLSRLAGLSLRRDRDRLAGLTRRLGSNSPRATIQRFNSRLDVNRSYLSINIQILINKSRSALRELSVKLDALNPLAILRRGYSVTRALPDKSIVTDPAQVALEQDVEVLLADGLLLCNVKGKSKYGQENL